MRGLVDADAVERLRQTQLRTCVVAAPASLFMSISFKRVYLTHLHLPNKGPAAPSLTRCAPFDRPLPHTKRLSNLQDSNSVLGSFNDLCVQKHPSISSDLAKSAKLVKSIKNDLQFIHKHSR